MPALASLSPDKTLLLLTAGVTLIYVELNRPGMILPGCTGLALVLLCVARFMHAPIALLPARACLLGFALLAVSIQSRSRIAVTLLATAALLYGLPRLVPPGSGLHAYVAIPCALFLGLGTSLLTTIAVRARQNKRRGQLP